MVGTFLADEDGVRIPFVSLISWGLSSQLDEGGFGGVARLLLSNGFSALILGGAESAVPFWLIKIGVLIFEGLGWGFGSMRGGGIPVS